MTQMLKIALTERWSAVSSDEDRAVQKLVEQHFPDQNDYSISSRETARPPTFNFALFKGELSTEVRDGLLEIFHKGKETHFDNKKFEVKAVDRVLSWEVNIY